MQVRSVANRMGADAAIGAMPGGTQPGQLLGAEDGQILREATSRHGGPCLCTAPPLNLVQVRADQARPAQLRVVLGAARRVEALLLFELLELVDQHHAQRLQETARGGVRMLGDSDNRAAVWYGCGPPTERRADCFPAQALTPGRGKHLVRQLGASLTSVVGADGHEPNYLAAAGKDDGPRSGRRRVRALPSDDTLLRHWTAQKRPDPGIGQQLSHDRGIFRRDRAQDEAVGAHFGRPHPGQGDVDGVHGIRMAAHTSTENHRRQTRADLR